MMSWAVRWSGGSDRVGAAPKIPRRAIGRSAHHRLCAMIRNRFQVGRGHTDLVPVSHGQLELILQYPAADPFYDLWDNVSVTEVARKGESLGGPIRTCNSSSKGTQPST